MIDDKNLAKRDKTGCWRCGSYNISLFRDISQYKFGFNARLCAECLNDSEIYLREHPLFIKYLEVGDTIHVKLCQVCSDGAERLGEIKTLRTEERELSRQLFTLMETWTDDIIERPAPPKPPPPTEEEIATWKDRKRERLHWQLQMLDLPDQPVGPAARSSSDAPTQQVNEVEGKS